MFCPACGQPLPLAAPSRCTSCGRRQWKNPKPCAGALVQVDDEVLLVKRAREPWPTHWDVPGGFCEDGEHPIETAERELSEELGLEVVVDNYLGAWIDTYPATLESGAARTLNLYYCVRLPVRPTLVLDRSEIVLAGWFTPDRPPEPLVAHVVQVLVAYRRRLMNGSLAEVVDRPDRSRASS